MKKTEFIQKLGAELSIDPSKLSESAELASFATWDSMGQVAVVGLLDTELGFQAPQGALQKLVTVGDLLLLVQDKLEK